MEDREAKHLPRECVTLLTKCLPILRKVYNTCVETYPINSIIPRVTDVFLDPVVQDLFNLPPLSTNFTENDLETLGALFPDIVRRWQSITEELLLNMIAQSQKTKSLFQLATTSNFSCLVCQNDTARWPVTQ